ncbi:low molecular weight phosphotyrosine protein phosphatase-like, partial [Hyposmocoma kahamanoa]|uniref:low molecular weight phosphotyrosine protein phosphatase-like n=1 Tax=Hyposmocoma kahamanoa TaxID=1477025 RepID=UPI000E6D9C4C
MSDEKKKVLFVCLGNTCRSPIAECVFQKTVKELGQADQWEIDSAAIADWHVGDTPNWRSLATLQNFDVPYNNNVARQV